MAPRARSVAQPDHGGIELKTRSSAPAPPEIEVTDLSPTVTSGDSSSSPGPSSASSGSPAPVPTPPSPQTSTCSSDVADAAVCNVQEIAESLDGSTLQPSVTTGRSNSSPSPTIPDQADDATEESPRAHGWGELFSTDTAKKIMSLSVMILTIVTVVYSHRSFVLEKWNNLAAWYSYCNGTSNNIEVSDGCD